MRSDADGESCDLNGIRCKRLQPRQGYPLAATGEASSVSAPPGSVVGIDDIVAADLPITTVLLRF